MGRRGKDEIFAAKSPLPNPRWRILVLSAAVAGRDGGRRGGASRVGHGGELD